MSDADLNVMIATLRRIAGPTIVPEIAREAAPLIEKALKKTAAAGTSPDGAPWAATKAGGAPMLHAAEHITSQASGGRVLATLTGPDVWHQLGVRGEPRRVVIPTGSQVPDVVAGAAAKGAERVFDRIMGSR